MAAQIKLFHRLFWLLDTVYSAKQISLSQIDKRWEQSHYNDKHEREYGKRNLHRHREDIAELFGIEIVCDRTTNLYSIAERGDLDGNGLRAWLVDTYAVSNMVNLAGDMKDQIIFEETSDGSRYLSTIVSAMKEKRQLYATYQGYKRTEPHSFLLAPYCLKVCRRRWYLVGKPADHPEEDQPRVYALDRMKELVIVDKSYDIPRKFHAKDFFKNQYGVDRTIAEPEKIVVRLTEYDANFMRSLPLHHSQTELKTEDGFCYFTFFVAPTYDFIQELRKFGSTLEVLEPASLRNQFKIEAENMQKMYL